jgi:two-component system sensor histidine kinase HydH
MNSPVQLLGRFGLLASTVAMGGALVATSVAGFQGAQQAAEALLQSRSADVAFAVRHELRRSGADDPAALEGILAELSEQEVRYVGMLDHEGAVVASAGRAMDVSPVEPGRARAPAGPQVQWRRVGERIRVVAGLGPPGRGRMGMGRGPLGGLREGGPGAAFVVEYLPVAASALVARAEAGLIASCAAAGLLFAIALLSWRQAREAERLGAQLARDQQLKSLGQMSAVLSHELRNPLTSLKGTAQLLLEKLAPEHAGRAGAERILSGALRLEAIANQILDFARPAALNLAPEDPGVVAKAAIELVGDARSNLAVEPGLGTWQLDRLRIEQLLVNLVRNAAEASPEAAPIEVSVGREEGALVFAVRDHGAGLPPGEEARIFEPFFGRRVRGTGLGLAVAKQIADAHGGRLEGATLAAGGALFRLVLPRREERPA